MTVEELARQFNVSTKTISRWRRLGLVSRRFVMDGRKRVGFLQSTVERFVAENADKVRRGDAVQPVAARRSGTLIIRRARRLAQAGASPGRGRPPPGPQDRPQPGNHPLHAEAVRPGPSRPGRVSRQLRPDPHGDQAEDLPAVSIAANRSRPWRSGFAARGRASTGSSPRCAPQRILRAAAGLHPQRGVRPGHAVAEAGAADPGGRCRPATSR